MQLPNYTVVPPLPPRGGGINRESSASVRHGLIRKFDFRKIYF